jgi:hypothetical protein
MPENEEAAPAAEAQQDGAQTSDAKAEGATSTATAGDELTGDDLAAVAGGAWSKARS